MLSMDQIKFQGGKQLVYERGDRDGSRDISQGKRETGITENERFIILVRTIGLRKDKYVMSLFHQSFAERCHGPHDTVNHGVIIVGKKCNVQSLLRCFVK